MEVRTTTQRQLPMLVRMDWPDPTIRGLEIISRSIAVSVEVAVAHASETFAPEGARYGGSVAVRRISLNSPLELLLTIHAAAVASVGTISLLAYGLKRLCGLDLEIRTHRTQLQADLLEARHRLDRAQELRVEIDHEILAESIRRRSLSPTPVSPTPGPPVPNERHARQVADALAPPADERLDPDLVTKVERARIENDAVVGYVAATGEATIEDTAA